MGQILFFLGLGENMLQKIVEVLIFLALAVTIVMAIALQAFKAVWAEDIGLGSFAVMAGLTLFRLVKWPPPPIKRRELKPYELDLHW